MRGGRRAEWLNRRSRVKNWNPVKLFGGRKQAVPAILSTHNLSPVRENVALDGEVPTAPSPIARDLLDEFVEQLRPRSTEESLRSALEVAVAVGRASGGALVVHAR